MSVVKHKRFALFISGKLETVKCVKLTYSPKNEIAVS